MDAYTEVGGRATQEAKAEVIGTTPWMGKVELCRDDHTDVGGRILPGANIEQQSRVESGTETESNAGRL